MKIYTAKKPRELSEVKNPCRMVWDICEALPNASRKQIIEACLAAGICFGTASTQQNKWRKQHIAKSKPSNPMEK